MALRFSLKGVTFAMDITASQASETALFLYFNFSIWGNVWF
jgi:hypothetical protein